jgi:hypothetical protein
MNKLTCHKTRGYPTISRIIETKRLDFQNMKNLIMWNHNINQ